MHISGINFESLVDGEGLRATIYISGCNHKCKGCQNINTWDFSYGKIVDDNIIDFINQELNKRKNMLSGITLSGGDPMYSASEVIDFISKIEIPNNDIWIYSGFYKEEIDKDKNMNNLLNKCNVLIDGPFILEQRDITLKFRGSANQRIWRKDNSGWYISNE